MELRHLRYFVIVAEEEHLTRAAERLHISQPPLSRQMRDLEEELGVRLFERTANAIRLTEAGRRFLKDAREILRRVEEAVAQVRSEARPNRERVEVGYSPTLGGCVLSEAMAVVQRATPGLRVFLRDLSTEESTRLVAEGVLTFSVQARPRRLPNRSLMFEPLFELPFRLLAPEAAFGTEPVPVGWIKRLLIFDREEYPEYWMRVGRFLRGAGVKPRIEGSFDTASSLAAAVGAGAGVALVPVTFPTPPRTRLFEIDPAGAVEVGLLRPRREELAGADPLLAAIRGEAARRRNPDLQPDFTLEA